MPKLKPMNPGCCCGAPTGNPCVGPLAFRACFTVYGGGDRVANYSYSGHFGDVQFSGSGTHAYYAPNQGTGGTASGVYFVFYTDTLTIPYGPVRYGSATVTITPNAPLTRPTTLTYHFCNSCPGIAPKDGFLGYYLDDNNSCGDTLSGPSVAANNCPQGYPPYSDNTSNPQTAAMPAFRAGAALPAAPTLRVGLITAHLLLGGAEGWQLALASSLATLLGQTVTFVGAVNLGQSDPTMVADLSALMPVTTGFDAARTLAGSVDLVITWAVLDYAALYAGLATPPRTLFACHLPSAWGADTARMLGPVDAFVAVSSFAQAPIPAPLALKSSVIWNAVDAARLTTPRSRAVVRASWGIAS